MTLPLSIVQIDCENFETSCLKKKSQLNCKTNTGHIHKVKHRPESCNSQLSNAPKNIKNGAELVEK